MSVLVRQSYEGKCRAQLTTINAHRMECRRTTILLLWFIMIGSLWLSDAGAKCWSGSWACLQVPKFGVPTKTAIQLVKWEKKWGQPIAANNLKQWASWWCSWFEMSHEIKQFRSLPISSSFLGNASSPTAYRRLINCLKSKWDVDSWAVGGKWIKLMAGWDKAASESNNKCK